MTDAAIRLHLSDGIELADLDKKYSDTGKNGHTRAHSAKVAEVQGLVDVEVMEEVALEEVR